MFFFSFFYDHWSAKIHGGRRPEIWQDCGLSFLLGPRVWMLQGDTGRKKLGTISWLTGAACRIQREALPGGFSVWPIISHVDLSIWYKTSITFWKFREIPIKIIHPKLGLSEPKAGSWARWKMPCWKENCWDGKPSRRQFEFCLGMKNVERCGGSFWRSKVHVFGMERFVSISIGSNFSMLQYQIIKSNSVCFFFSRIFYIQYYHPPGNYLHRIRGVKLPKTGKSIQVLGANFGIPR